MMKNLVFPTCLVLLLIGSLSTAFAQEAPSPSFTELDYAGDNHLRQAMDLYTPVHMEGALPVVVYIHGGGWRGGDKGNAMQYADSLLAAGYMVADISYRLSKDAPWPAQIEDCKAAIRYLKLHADRFGIDPDRIGVMGHSAGGHLAAMLACGQEEKDLEGPYLRDMGLSSSVAAAIDFYGPTDFLRMNDHPPDSAAWSCKNTIDHNSAESPEGLLLGCAPPDCPERVAAANPATYVNGSEAPIWLVHGTQDCLVPTDQSEYLHKRLQEVGSIAELTLIEGAGHGGAEFTSPEMRGKIRAFFDQHLKPETTDKK